MSRLTYEMKIIGRCAADFKNERLQQYDLITRQADVILSVFRNPGISQDDLAKAMVLNKSTMTRLLPTLEEKGLIERRVSPTDRRETLNYLTPAGEALVPEIRRINSEWAEYLMAEFSEEEAQAMEALLGKAARRAKEYKQGRLKP